MSLMTPIPPAPDDTGPDPQAQARAGYIAGLRALAAVLEDNPAVPMPYAGNRSRLMITFFGLDPDDAKAKLADTARAFPCPWRKQFSGETGQYLDLLGELHGLQLVLCAPRDAVCERVVTGTETRDVVEVVQPEVTRTVTREVEVVEWRCGSLLGPGGARG